MTFVEGVIHAPLQEIICPFKLALTSRGNSKQKMTFELLRMYFILLSNDMQIVLTVKECLLFLGSCERCVLVR